MRLVTRHFGTIDFQDEKSIHFPYGLVGFPKATAFCLLEDPVYKPYHWLQCIPQPGLAFVVVPMIAVKEDYQLSLSDADAEWLGVNESHLPLILGIVVMAQKLEDVSVNFLAPLVINESKRLGAQIVNDQFGYRSSHKIMDEMVSFAREGKSHAGADTKKKAVVDVGR